MDRLHRYLHVINIIIMVISVPAIYAKSILGHNILFAVYIFGRMKVIETIVTVVYKQGNLVLRFRQTQSSYFNL